MEWNIVEEGKKERTGVTHTCAGGRKEKTEGRLGVAYSGAKGGRGSQMETVGVHSVAEEREG